jgi:Flp pilus assembly protein TadG
MTNRSFAGLPGATSGATAVEFALVASAFLTLLFGIVEFGRAYWDYQVIQEVATEGARCMGLHASSCASGTPKACNVQAATAYMTALSQTRGLTLPNSAVVTPATSCAATCGGTAGLSRVQISYRFTTVVPALIGPLNGKTLTATACFPNS